MRNSVKTNPQKRCLIAGILCMVLGLFLVLVLIGFHPEDSLYFTNHPALKVGHFLGKTGVTVSGFLFYYLGRSSFVFAILLFIAGFVLIRRISTSRKIGYILIDFFAIFFSLGVFSRPQEMPFHKSGGIFGSALAHLLSGSIRKDILFIIFLTLFTGTLVFLFKVPLRFLFSLFLKRTGRFSGRLHSAGIQKIGTQKGGFQQVSYKGKKTGQKPSRELKQQVEEGREGQPFYLQHVKNKKKPPLIQRVFIDNDPCIPVQCEQFEDEEPPPVESATGQYLFSERDPQSSARREGKRVDLDASILKKSKSMNIREREKETIRKARELERTLDEFGIDAKVMGITRGPVITRYELQPAPGVKLSRIVNLSDNIALSLSANGVRIEAPIPGRAAVGIEIPNEEREIVTLGDIIVEAQTYGELPLILGKDISGKIVVADLAEMPHLLIAGATGSGKSVCVNSLIVSLLFKKKPEEVRFLMIDPKMVELKIYNGIPHLLTEVVTDPRDASRALRWLIHEMENRYRLLDENFARDITGYNRKVKEKIPYIIIIVDEFANLMAISQKEVEDAVVRLAAMSRAVGIHLIMATQRPSVDVITGLIKANFPYRIAFQVASKTDSRTILDTVGAEKLCGRGDMLFSPAGSLHIRRIQGTFISEEEVFSIVKDLREKNPPEYREDVLTYDSGEALSLDENDPIFDDAVEIVLKTKRASASFLQRRLKIGYNRAARLIELMEERGIIGPPRGSKPREIFVDRLE